MAKIAIENAKPLVGGIVHVDKAHLCDDDVIAEIKAALEQRGVLVFPELHATDEEQLTFTDKIGRGSISLARFRVRTRERPTSTRSRSTPSSTPSRTTCSAPSSGTSTG